MRVWPRFDDVHADGCVTLLLVLTVVLLITVAVVADVYLRPVF